MMQRPIFDKNVASALKAMKEGIATPSQQKDALNWIIAFPCLWGKIAYHPDPRLTDFNLGRQFVAETILHITETPFNTLFNQEGAYHDGASSSGKPSISSIIGGATNRNAGR